MQKFYRSFKIFGLGFLSYKSLSQLQKIESDVFEFFSDMVNWKKNGYFLEFGAADGINLSNTYLLERDFGWSGILAEPAKVWHKDLKANRTSAIDFSCVWSKSGEVVNFTVTPEAEYSTISSFIKSDGHASTRNHGETYPVNTISLNDLLIRHKAPSKIDYLSIDTEGSELEILEAFDFDKYAISVITCEHNFSSKRSKIFDLLSSNGFVRAFEGFSRWDDWYIHPRHIAENSATV